MRAGPLNRRILIQRRQTGEDAAGQPLLGWEDVVSLWANIKGQTGMGSITGLQDNVAASINLYSFRIRYKLDLDVGMRVVYSNTPFDIRQIRHDHERHEWTDLVCEQGGSDG